jgi:glycosyltransferase involved in cell wall biosynthesis
VFRVRPGTWAAFVARLRFPRLQGFEFGLLRGADRVLTLTRRDRFSLLSFAPDLPITVIPCGIDVDQFEAPADAEREDCLVFTGNYRDPDNEDAVLWFGRRVWPSVAARHPGLRFYAVGPNPTPAMQALADEGDHFRVTGEVHDVRPWLARARLFVAPLRTGSGLRVKILEAMAAGAPLVATSAAVEGIPAHAGHNCMLADRPDLMASSIRLMLDDPPLRRALADRARAMVRERFSWNQRIDELEEVLHGVLESGG